MTTLHTRRFVSRTELDAALVECLARTISSGAATAIMLSGGKTPLPAYNELAARGPKHNDHLHILFSDDRYVPSTSDDSNYHRSCELLNALGLPEDSLLRVRTELPLEDAALDYERKLAALLKSGVPIKLGLLGLGPDGMAGISVTPEFLRHVEKLVFVVAGGGKHDAIRSLMNGDTRLIAWQAVQGARDVELWVEQAALSSLMA